MLYSTRLVNSVPRKCGVCRSDLLWLGRNNEAVTRVFFIIIILLFEIKRKPKGIRLTPSRKSVLTNYVTGMTALFIYPKLYT